MPRQTPQHVVVTGGGSGLGLGCALRYLRRGARVSVLDRLVGDAAQQQLAAAAGAGGAGWAVFLVDITDEVATRAAVNGLVQQNGAPDLVIHCAGILLNRAVADTSGADFQRVVDVNLNGSFHVASAVLPHLRPGSRLALVASMAGLTSNYAYAAYGASKFGVVGLATTLRLEYGPRGIGISCICPPEVKTPMVAAERTPGQFNEIAMALKDHAGSLALDPAVDAIVAGLDAGRWMIIPGWRAKAISRIVRFLPGLFFFIMNRLVRRELRRRGVPTH